MTDSTFEKGEGSGAVPISASASTGSLVKTVEASEGMEAYKLKKSTTQNLYVDVKVRAVMPEAGSNASYARTCVGPLPSVVPATQCTENTILCLQDYDPLEHHRKVRIAPG